MTTIGRLDPFFTSLITDLMGIEKRPLDLLRKQRDSINVTRGAYTDVDTRLSALQTAVQHLTSTNAFYDLTIGRSATITNTPTDTTVLTTSVTSSAVPGEYEIDGVSGITLAQAERYASNVQTSADQALGETGSFWLGGTGTASTSGSSATVASVALASVGSGLQELGTGTAAASTAYTLDVRDNNGTLEFRLLDADGNAVAIADKTVEETTSLTTGWQTLTASETYDTKRGLSITFGSSPATGETTIDYTAAGVEVTVASTDSLIHIANNINDALQPEGHDLTASVVGTQLVFTAVETGTNHTINGFYSTDTSLTFTSLQSAGNASFTVNGISFTRQSNTNLTDVISGVTLNLAADAGGNSATLAVTQDFSPATSAIDDFITKFNDVVTFLQEKTSISEQFDGTYRRGTLASETIFSQLRFDLISHFYSNQTASGSFDNLRDIGLTIGDDLKATVSDSEALSNALKSNFSDVAALLDEVMGGIDTLLSRFTGNVSGYMDTADGLFDDQIDGIDDRITYQTERLAAKEQFLIKQYSAMQAQLMSLAYMQQIWQGIYGNSPGGINRFA